MRSKRTNPYEIMLIQYIPERLKEDYLDIFEGVMSYVMYTTKYDENSDIGTTYLRVSMMRGQDELRVEHRPPITEDSYMPDKLLDGTNCKTSLI